MTRERTHRSHSSTPGQTRSAARPAAQAAHPIERLQQQIGNQQVMRMLAQPDVEVQREADEDELQMQRDPALQREADEDELQMQRDPALQREADEDELQMQRDPALQREADEDELQMQRDPALQREADEDELQMQRDPALQRQSDEDEGIAPEGGPEGGPVSPETAGRINGKRGGGAPLNETARLQMERSFNTSFADVRLHTDGESHTLNRKLGARAFTTGSDIFFSKSAGPQDTRLLAHELTHVVQQRGMSGGGQMQVGPAGDRHEQEADAMAASATSGSATAQDTAQRSPDEAAVQRQPAVLQRDGTGSSPYPDSLTKGLAKDMDTQAAAQVLLQNFKDKGFNYTMRYSGANAAIAGHGDCLSLAQAFVKVLNATLGRQVAAEDGTPKSFLAPGGATIDPTMAGNTDDASKWIFANHYWADVEGKKYDVLFGRELDQSGWVFQTEPKLLVQIWDKIVGAYYDVPRSRYGATVVYGPYQVTDRANQFTTGTKPNQVVLDDQKKHKEDEKRKQEEARKRNDESDSPLKAFMK